MRTSISLKEMIEELVNIKKAVSDDLTIWVEHQDSLFLKKIKFMELGDHGDECGIIIKTGDIE
jgi:hypothetical protein